MRRFLIGVVLLAIGSVGVAAVLVAPYLRHLDAVVAEKFAGKRWDFPSKIYSDSCFVYPGLDIEAIGLIERLRRLNYRQVSGPVSSKGEYSIAPDAVQLWLHDFQFPSGARTGEAVRLALSKSTVAAIERVADHEPLYTVEIEPELITGLYENVWEERHLVTLDDVPPLLPRAIMAVEDQHFYEHHGIDPMGIARALWVNLRSGQTVQGGSTLTQQLVKNFLLTPERSLERKLKEFAMALVVEHRYSKREILEAYLNEIYLGQRGAQGVYGVWEAAQFYFAKPLSDLSVAEMALLAAVIKAPNRYSPFRDPQRALHRRNYCLTLMLKQGDITDEQYQHAIAEPLRLAAPKPAGNDAPYFVDFLRQELARSYPAAVLTTEGLSIFTSLDMEMQRAAEESLRRGLEALEQRYKRLRSESPSQALQGALIAVQPQTGEIKAMMGGRDYRATQFNRVTQAQRQPGSVFKPFVYLAAFERTLHGEGTIQPTSSLDDEPFEWFFDNQVWSPANYKGKYFGDVTVRHALEFSLNAATSHLARDIGIDAVREVAQRLGIGSPLPAVPSLALGSVEVTPFEVAQAYSTLASQGLRATPLSVKRVIDHDGNAIERNPVEVTQAVDPAAAYLVIHLMEGVLRHGTGAGARRLGFKRPAAGKTGTTNDYHDAWFAGFTPDLLAVVWVGFDQKKPVGLAGGEAALPIWTEFMKRATAGRPETSFVPPADVALVSIDEYTGELATPNCPEVIEEAFFKGYEPTQLCHLHAPSLTGVSAPAPRSPDYAE
ncbi:MAG TPA: PBP1A family penicillin-binding protein [Candidatus Binatia bacterium]|nr:PBP1A family penicillin-binding protein [Candidatus Binatia bacterium]